MQWEYFDRMVIFNDAEGGMVSGLDAWINGAGAEGWELVSSAPLIAPNKDGVAYGTIGLHLIFKRAAGGSAGSVSGRGWVERSGADREPLRPPRERRTVA